VVESRLKGGSGTGGTVGRPLPALGDIGRPWVGVVLDGRLAKPRERHDSLAGISPTLPARHRRFHPGKSNATSATLQPVVLTHANPVTTGVTTNGDGSDRGELASRGFAASRLRLTRSGPR
jgi:hypothetical protein